MIFQIYNNLNDNNNLFILHDFSNGIRNPYKFSSEEKIAVYIEYIYKNSKLNKTDFKNEVEKAMLQLSE